MSDPKDPKEPSSAKASAGEEDKVAAAYENISKKLESLRSGKEDEDEEDGDEAAERRSGDSNSEEELEEWKGPTRPSGGGKPMKNPEVPEEDEVDLRRVKLKNLDREEDQESDEAAERRSDEENDEDDEGEDEEKGSNKHHEEDDEEDQAIKLSSYQAIKQEERESAAKEKNWEPKENDPLDEEEEESDEAAERRSGEKTDDDEEKEEDELPIQRTADEESVAANRTKYSDVGMDSDSPVRKNPQPDTLDDLTEDRPVKREEEDDDYFIPNLKGSGQRTGSMEYNAPIERESYGESYKQSLRSDDLQKSSMDNDPNNYFSQHSQPQPAKRANKFHLLILVIIGVVVIGFTVYILKGGFGELSLSTQPSPSPSATATPEPTPTPTPEPEVERGNFTVRVLNGTSTTGLAGKIRDKLKELGYKTSTPGNASDTDVAQTEIRVKEGTESASLFERLKLDLAPDYDVTQGEALDSKAAYDAEVILGAK